MVKNKKADTGDERLEVVEEALGRSEQFIEKNSKIITIVVLVIVAGVLAYLGINRYFLEPREKEAQWQMFQAERYFEQDSLTKALNGDGNNLGFLEIIADYSMTKTANLARYYAGISYLRLGDYSEAIKQLDKFKGRDNIVAAMALTAKADAMLELGQTAKAAGVYESTSKKFDNELIAPMALMKAGRAYELAGNNKKALEMYETLFKNYPNTNEGRLVEKFIARLKAN
ncbi:MAG TPA: tetratricopeptide repeat protein [Bacteroidales bacterium]|nr:tetratricopeptide repeat protein [Bacteroidales bacterium]